MQTPLHGSGLMERFVAEPKAHQLVGEAAVHFLHVCNALKRIAEGGRDPCETAEHGLRNLGTALELMAQAQKITLGHIDEGLAELSKAIEAGKGK